MWFINKHTFFVLELPLVRKKKQKTKKHKAGDHSPGHGSPVTVILL